MKPVTSVKLIMETLFYANKFYANTLLIKLGGSILHDAELMQSLCEDIKLIKGCGIKIILVHGGSKFINKALEISGIETKFMGGLRVTSPEAMKIIETVLCGQVNKLLVRKLNSIGLNAVGLSGSDNNMLLCEPYSLEHGCVGKIKAVNMDVVESVLSLQGVNGGPIPVIAPIGVDDHGNPLNVNADWAACAIACALKVNKLIYLTDQDGIYGEDGNVFPLLLEKDLHELINKGLVKDGMLTKVKTILSAFKENINGIHVLNGIRKHCLIEELFTISGVGTLCER